MIGTPHDPHVRVPCHESERPPDRLRYDLFSAVRAETGMLRG